VSPDVELVEAVLVALGIVVVERGAVVTVAGTVVAGTGICTPGGSELICRQ
jgi:hypothetical protein